jgi:hypothetical protein
LKVNVGILGCLSIELAGLNHVDEASLRFKTIFTLVPIVLKSREAAARRSRELTEGLGWNDGSHGIWWWS